MSAFVKAARFVGDLDDEFYADELQRDIWNEASAVGFQALLWIGLITGAILPFAAGVTGAWVALGIYLALNVVAFVVLGYARARGIDMYTAQELRRVRIGLAAVLLVVSGGGAAIRLLAHYGGGGLGSLSIGAVFGASLGFAAAVVGVRLHQRKQRETERAAEEAEALGFESNE
ncbi:hypothetical protein [Rhodococcus sp. KRD162]|uniref:hypothetical protein n=1 Tax=Rhodococcus sp. KRD162 TaxID=2729725 RepID=UPI0019D038DA|nr:hypothetical protein [Rhodococcus sp. KRD162]